MENRLEHHDEGFDNEGGKRTRRGGKKRRGGVAHRVNIFDMFFCHKYSCSDAILTSANIERCFISAVNKLI